MIPHSSLPLADSRWTMAERMSLPAEYRTLFIGNNSAVQQSVAGAVAGTGAR